MKRQRRNVVPRATQLLYLSMAEKRKKFFEQHGFAGFRRSSGKDVHPAELAWRKAVEKKVEFQCTLATPFGRQAFTLGWLTANSGRAI